MSRWRFSPSRLLQLPLFAAAILLAACNDSGLAPTSVTANPGGTIASFSGCTSDTSQIRILLNQAFQTSPKLGNVLTRWGSIQNTLNVVHNLTVAQHQTLEFADVILAANRAAPLTISASDLSSLINQIFCFVSLQSNVADPTNTWVVHVADPLTTLVTSDKSNGIQLPPNSVTSNTLITAIPINHGSLVTLLDNYANVYDWSLTPAQTLTPGTKATIAMCPSVTALANVPLSELDDLLNNLVLGHQRAAGDFELLTRVPLPPQMNLQCPDPTSSSVHAGLGRKLLNTLAGFFLPERANASRRRFFVGGVGGSTSEFSPFGPVDPRLFASGGVGGSTSEFVRTRRGASLMADPGTPIDGTVGTIRTGANLPNVTITTFQGTPIPNISVSFITNAPVGYAPSGDAALCGVDGVTNGQGFAAVNCLSFGTTRQYRTAYTKLTATFGLPDELATPDANGNPIVTISPPFQNWLLVSHGPSTLVVTQPTPGHTVAAGTPFSSDAPVPARVEIRSDLGDVVPGATNTVTLSLNKNTFAGGSTTVSANASQGVAVFSPQLPTAANGYRFIATASLSDIGPVTSGNTGNLFDVIPGTAARITILGNADYGSVPTTANPVSPSPRVLVTDANNNPKTGVTVFWTPAGGNGATANGSTSQVSSVNAADGTSSVTWLLGGGSNQLRASLQSAAGGAEVFFTGTLTAPNPNDPCEPGAVKDAFGNCYFVTPGRPGGGLLRGHSSMLIKGP